MRRLVHLGRLLAEVVGYAWRHKVWWLVPVIVILLLVAFLVVVGSGTAPFIYTIF